VYKRLRVKFTNTTLRKKIIFLVSLLVTITPTILVTILALTYYKFGIEALFSEKISKAIDNTVEVAELYLQEHKDNIKADILTIAKFIDLNYFTLINDPTPDLFVKFLDKQAELLDLSEVVIFQKDRMVAKNTFSFALNFEKLPSDEDLKKAEGGDVVLLSSADNNRVRALLKLNNFGMTTYLMVGKYIDQSVLNHLKDSQGSASHYQLLMHDMNKTLTTLEIIFIIASAGLCILAVFSGIKLARFITDPINLLVKATESVKKGDFSIRIPEKTGRDETAILTRSFNQMISTLSDQRNQILKVNKIIDERRRFIETVLAEISSGVIALSPEGDINFCNNSAMNLFGTTINDRKTLIDDLLPWITELVAKAKANIQEIHSENIELTLNEKKYNLFVRAGSQINDKGELENIIVTFDDITDLVSAQRSAAWSDVARRIAHEIKNPLTPIQLCAERLKKKYIAEIKHEPEKFEQYVDTIIRHVGDIGQIVEEFVEFARIPSPKMKKNSINHILTNALFEQENTFKDIEYTFSTSLKNCFVLCDATLIGQALLNILKNSAESINARLANNKKLKGCIQISLAKVEEGVEIKISDNGLGFDSGLIDRVFEPYITTKESGTGLGMSIVKKIIEDHGGKIQIGNSPDGAFVKFNLFIYQEKKNV
jgi:two-component system, NtrC family, nitrogen regulation sensor histidine kinase NtrY